ncbi:MAG: hypothetical protein PF545_03110 [Elusimicrobia bacterium]|jgi:hypothetical protein|nr:hypothetical protein [Elusimicrobiota bacterium]
MAVREGINVYTSYLNGLFGNDTGYLGVISKLTESSNIGFNAGYFKYPDTVETQKDPASKYNYRVTDENISASAGFMGLYYSGAISKNIYYGSGIRFAAEHISDYYTAGAAVFDGGFIVKKSSGVNLGISFKNLSWGAYYPGGLEPLPASVSAGVKINQFVADPASTSTLKYDFFLGGEFRYGDDIYLKAGIELRPYRFLKVRTGYSYNIINTDDLGGLGGLGAGVELLNPFNYNDRVSFEYCLELFGRLGLTHRVSFSFLI